MSVVIQNNSGSTGGQNFINSTNFPISQIGFTITGVSNVLSPANTSAMDPNGCAGSTIQPGGTCTFYLQLNGEAFPVNSVESVQIALNYTINDTLFGGSTNTGSATTTVYELTNLYTMQQNGYLTVLNKAWNNYGLIESADTTVNSIAVDTSSYGLLYLSGQLGVYQYGVSNNIIASTSISPTGYSGANNLVPVGNNMYAALMATSINYSVWNFSFSGESWTGQAFQGNLTSLVKNANALSPTPVLYLAQIGQIYACQTLNGSGCPAEGMNGISGNVNSLGFLSGASSGAPVSGLYAGTPSGLFYESGTTPNINATWGQVSGISTPINTIITATDSGGSILFAGDNVGNIWEVVPSDPESATLVATLPGSPPISAIAADAYGGVLYVATNNNIYLCSSDTCTSVLGIVTSSPVQGLAIGSALLNTLNNPANMGQL